MSFNRSTSNNHDIIDNNSQKEPKFDPLRCNSLFSFGMYLSCRVASAQRVKQTTVQPHEGCVCLFKVVTNPDYNLYIRRN
jgi:hypothetical protein